MTESFQSIIEWEFKDLIKRHGFDKGFEKAIDISGNALLWAARIQIDQAKSKF